MQIVEMIGWLEKIWDEDEKAAKWASTDLEEVLRMRADQVVMRSKRRHQKDADGTWHTMQWAADWVKVAGPPVTLARIAAERALLAEYRETATYYDNVSAPAGEVTGLETALKIIASGYAARPGYDEGWRP